MIERSGGSVPSINFETLPQKPKIPRGCKIILHVDEPIPEGKFDIDRMRLFPLDPRAYTPKPSERNFAAEVSEVLSPEGPNTDGTGMWRDTRKLFADLRIAMMKSGAVPLSSRTLDHLSQHENMIPKKWEDLVILFPSTHYENRSTGEKFIRTLLTPFFTVGTKKLMKELWNKGGAWRLLAAAGVGNLAIGKIMHGNAKYTSGEFDLGESRMRFLSHYYVAVYFPDSTPADEIDKRIADIRGAI